VTLDIAGWRDGDVHARKVVVRFFLIAGVILNLLPNLIRQVRHLVAATAATAGRTTLGLFV